MSIQRKTTPVSKAVTSKPIDFRVLRMKDVVAITNLCDATIYDLIARGIFPPPFKIVPGGRAAGWASSTILTWLEERATDQGKTP